ncbi:hypothetical protein GF362_02625 [Candidatus Dojkabacteria bacterium]|nr:hypothetical protein [Candidatus Dojkabacteria bacterium]
MKTRKNVFYVFFSLLIITIMFTANAASVFPDIEDNMFKEYITNLYNDEIISGYSDGLYHPEKEVTRGAMAKFVRRGFNKRIVGTSLMYLKVIHSMKI